eukprot:20923-Heterococcus_DN1.PRE.2
MKRMSATVSLGCEVVLFEIPGDMYSEMQTEKQAQRLLLLMRLTVTDCTTAAHARLRYCTCAHYTDVHKQRRCTPGVADVQARSQSCTVWQCNS